MCSSPPKTYRAKLQLIIICPGSGLKGSTGWYSFGAPHAAAASPWRKLSSYKDSALSCQMPTLGWQPQLEAGQPLLLSPWPLHVRSLGFLPAWWPWSSWASSLAVVFSRISVPRDSGISCQASLSCIPFPKSQRAQTPGAERQTFSLRGGTAFASRERRQTST